MLSEITSPFSRPVIVTVTPLFESARSACEIFSGETLALASSLLDSSLSCGSPIYGSRVTGLVVDGIGVGVAFCGLGLTFLEGDVVRDHVALFEACDRDRHALVRIGEVRLGDLLWRDADLGVELLRIFAVSRLAGGLSIGLGERCLGAGLLGGLSVS